MINLQNSGTEDNESDDHGNDHNSSGEGDDSDNGPLTSPLD
jgi:hypothetical protein